MSPLEWFQSLDGVPGALAIAGYFIGFAMALVFCGRALCNRLNVRNNGSSVSPSIAVIGTMMSILIGLVIVALWNDFRVARANVAAEGTELRGATRDVQLLARDARPRLMVDLRAYAEAVTRDEWPAMERHSNGSSSAGRALAELLIAADATRSTSLDLRTRVNRLAELRTMRLSEAASSSVVGLLWFALLVIPLLVLAGIALLNDIAPVMHYILAALAACAISIAVFVALQLDLVFNGVDGISPAPISTAIDQALFEASKSD